MKRFFYLFTAVLLCLGIICHSIVYFTAAEAFTGGNDKPIYCVDTDQNRVAISFDAAWGADKTLTILDILDEYKVKATFFLVGFWVDKYPEVVKEIAKRGHEIGNHSKNHPRMSSLSKEQIISEITSVNNQIFDCAAVKPTVFRPPFGDYNNTLVGCVRSLGMHTVQWSVDSLDWKELGCQSIVDRVLNNAEKGSIILFHNNAKYITQALPIILNKLCSEFEVGCVSDLIYTQNYTVDQRGIQYKNHE